MKRETPCDYLKDMNGMAMCPYVSSPDDYVNCEYWCGSEEPEDVPEEWEGDDEQ